MQVTVEDFERFGVNHPEWLVNDIPRYAEHIGVPCTEASKRLLAEAALLWELKRENNRELVRQKIDRKAYPLLEKRGRLDGERFLVVGDNTIYSNFEYYKERGMDPDAFPIIWLHIAEDEIGDTYKRLERGKLCVTVGRPNKYSELVLENGFDEEDYLVIVDCGERIVTHRRKGDLPNLNQDVGTMHIPYKFVIPSDEVHQLPTDYESVA